MKVVILAGGFGTRISEESHMKPKPMIEIGGMPILWHIMKNYSAHGFNEFIICLGYKQHMVKEFFSDYFLHTSDVTFDLQNNEMIVHHKKAEHWKVTLVDTGYNSMTGGRVRRIKEYVGEETFLLTYGDGVSNVDIKGLVEFHQNHSKAATITTVQPEGKFGVIDMKNNQVHSFREKNKNDNGWINAGFMVLEPSVFNLIEGDQTVFEKEPLETLAISNDLMAFKHNGFWQCMDTQRDKFYLEDLWKTGDAPWKVWKD